MTLQASSGLALKLSLHHKTQALFRYFHVPVLCHLRVQCSLIPNTLCAFEVGILNQILRHERFHACQQMQVNRSPEIESLSALLRERGKLGRIQASSRAFFALKVCHHQHHHRRGHAFHHFFLPTRLSDHYWLLDCILTWPWKARTVESGPRAGPRRRN